MTDTRLIEQGMPVAETGVESTRERTPMTPFPAAEPATRLVGAVSAGGVAGGGAGLPCQRKREPMTSGGGKGARPFAVRSERRDG